MKLRAITLKNFRQHQDTEIQFQDGLSAIVGPNGAGKSTVVEAIAFALYGIKAARGKSADILRRSAKLDDVVSDRANDRAQLLVRLVFEQDNKAFLIERSSDDAKICFAGREDALASGPREVSTFVSNLLGMNLEEFSATYLTEQKGLEFLGGRRGQAERERFIMRMMGYDRLEQMQELLRSDRRDLRNELLGSEGALGDRSNLEGRRSSEKEELSKIEFQVQEALKILKDGEAQEQRAQREVGLLENKAQSYKILIDKRKELELISSQLAERYNELNLESEQLKAKYCEQYRIKNGLEGPGALAQLLSELSINVEQSNAKLGQLELQIKAQRIALVNKESAWQEGLVPLKSRIAVFQAQLKALSDSKLRIEKLKKSLTKDMHQRSIDNSSLDSEQRCPTCFQVLAQDSSSVVAHFDSEISRICIELESSQAALKAQQIQPIEIQELRENIKSSEELELKIKNQLIELNQRINQHQLLERLSLELKKITQQQQSLALELESIQDQVKNLAFDESGYNQRKLELTTAERLTELARLQKLKLEGEEQTCRAMLHRTEEELLEYDIKLNKLSLAKQRQFCFDQADTVLTEFRRHLNASLRPRLADLASEYLSELTDGRYTSVILALDFTPSVLEDGEPKPVISGGEEDILNFCLRLALSQMLAERSNQSFSLLILDEIFGSLDHGRRNNVILLLEKLRARFEQIIIITHVEDLKDLVEHLIYIDYDEASRAVRVARLAEQQDDLGQISVNI